MEGRFFLLLVALSLTGLAQPTSGSAYSLQVGAVGDDASAGSIRVRVEIRTHIYQVQDASDAFWVGIELENGGFIQFGYTIPAAGAYCDNGEFEAGTVFKCAGTGHTVNGSEADWVWEYWPSPNDTRYYFGGGPAASAGLNATWHLYSIIPNSDHWSFLIDDRQVANADFSPTRSSSRAHFVAEKATSSTTPGSLGPVEFRNLAYLKADGWHMVTALYAIVGCGANPNCIPIPYGITALGLNHIIAGSSVPEAKDGELLWSETGTSMLTTSPTLIAIHVTPEAVYGGSLFAAAVLVVILLARRRRRARRPARRKFKRR